MGAWVAPENVDEVVGDVANTIFDPIKVAVRGDGVEVKNGVIFGVILMMR